MIICGSKFVGLRHSKLFILQFAIKQLAKVDIKGNIRITNHTQFDTIQLLKLCKQCHV